MTDHQPPPPAKPTNQSSFVLPLLVLLALAAGALIVFWPEGDGAVDLPERIDTRLPALQLKPLAGGDEVRLEDLRGKVALVNFFGTWCPPCRIEFPHLTEIAHRHEDREDFRFLPITFPRGEPLSETEAFLEQQPHRVAGYIDSEGVTQQAVTNTVGLEGFPTTLLLDREGTIRYRWVGYVPGTEREIAAAVAELLEEGS